MKKNENQNPISGKKKIIGLVICFAAAIVMVGTYTFRSYQKKLNDELAKSKELAQSMEENQPTTTNDIVNPEVSQGDGSGGLKENDKSSQDGNSAGSEEVGQGDGSTGSNEAGEAANETAKNVNFSADTVLEWPASGSVIMEYSMDHTIYFPTLAEYKYNPALIIGGTAGEDIRAGAAGVVMSVDETAQTGTTVTLDLGNGYTATYGQLKDVSIKKDDYVEKGSIVGYLNDPTKYYSTEGTNLYFAMKKDGKSINPMDYME